MSCEGVGSCLEFLQMASANISLKLMRAKTYYTDANQIKFIQAVGQGHEANMQKYLARMSHKLLRFCFEANHQRVSDQLGEFQLKIFSQIS